MNQPIRYLSYLLRLWRESNGDSQRWHASLEKPQTGQRLGFASLVELFTFLKNETGADTPVIKHDENSFSKPPVTEDL